MQTDNVVVDMLGGKCAVDSAPYWECLLSLILPEGAGLE